MRRDRWRRGWARAKKSGARGTTATECAIIMPLVLLLALGSCDFGRIAKARLVVANASRSGAEAGATRRYTAFSRADWEATVRDAVLEEMTHMPGFQEADLVIDIQTRTDSDDVEVITLTVDYPFRTEINWPLLPSVVGLSQRIEFRQYR